MDRRDFLKTAALGALGLGVIGKTAAAADSSAASELVVAHGGEAVAMWRKAIAALGGLGRWVKPGHKVVVKPNIGWNKAPEYAANTNPELVGAIVADAFAAGASRVIVFDHTCNDWRKCYRTSGIADAAGKAGATVIDAASEADYTERGEARALSLKTAKIFQPLLECDCFINVPILKHHGGAQMTAAMKNIMGAVWDRGAVHKGKLDLTIADLCLYRKPDLNVVDAYRMLVRRGPQGGNLKDVALGKFLLVSPDIVAIDAAATKLIGFDMAKIGYIANGEKLGLGVADLAKVKIQRIEMSGA